MYAFRCSDAGEGEDLEEWSLPTLLTFELAWSPEMVRRGHEKVLTVRFSAHHANLCVSIFTYRATRMGNRNEGLGARSWAHPTQGDCWCGSTEAQVARPPRS